MTNRLAPLLHSTFYILRFCGSFSLLLLTIALITLFTISAQAQSECYVPLRAKGDVAAAKGQYEKAINMYLAAMNCPEREMGDNLTSLIQESLKKRVYQLQIAITQMEKAQIAQAQAEEYRKIAEIAREEALEDAKRKAREALANNYAFKAQVETDRTTAFRLAEFANRIDPESPEVLQQLVNIAYQRENELLHYPMEGHSSSINAVVFFPDNKRVASASVDKTIIIWDVGSAKALFTLAGHGAPVRMLTLSNDGKQLISGDDDGQLIIWDIETRQKIFSLKAADQPVLDAVFLPGGDKIITGSMDSIRIWDIPTNKMLLEKEIHSAVSLDFCSQGQKAIVGLDYENDLTYDLETTVDATGRLSWISNEDFAISTINTFNIKVSAVAFHPEDCTKMLLGNSNGYLSISDNGPWQRLHYGSPIAAARFLPQIDYSTVGVLLENGMFKLVYYPTQQEQLSISLPSNKITTFAASSNGDYIVTGSAIGEVHIWKTKPDKQTGYSFNYFPLNEPETIEKAQKSAAIAPNGEKIIIGKSMTNDYNNITGFLGLWSADSLNPLINRPDNFGKHYSEEYMEPVNGSIQSVAFSLNAETFASGFANGDIVIFDKNHVALDSFKNHQRAVTSLAFSPDKALLASCAMDSTLIVWDLKKKRILHSLKHPGGFFMALQCSPDGRQLALGDSNGYTVLFDLKTGEQERVRSFHLKTVSSLNFPPVGNKLLTASFDGLAKITDLDYEEDPFTLAGHKSAITSSDYSSDGQMIATASQDGEVRIWDANKGNLIMRIKDLNSSWVTVMFHPVEPFLYTVTGEEIKKWLISSDVLIKTFNEQNKMSELSIPVMAEYNMYKDFNQAKINTSELIEEGNEERMFNIAHYYIILASQAGTMEEREQLSRNAIDLLEALTKIADRVPKEIYQEQLDSMRKTMEIEMEKFDIRR